MNANINAIKASFTDNGFNIEFGHMENEEAKSLCSINVLPEDYYALMQELVKLGITYEQKYKKNIGFSTPKSKEE